MKKLDGRTSADRVPEPRRDVASRGKITKSAGARAQFSRGRIGVVFEVVLALCYSSYLNTSRYQLRKLGRSRHETRLCAAGNDAGSSPAVPSPWQPSVRLPSLFRDRRVGRRRRRRTCHHWHPLRVASSRQHTVEPIPPRGVPVANAQWRQYISSPVTKCRERSRAVGLCPGRLIELCRPVPGRRPRGRP